MCTEGIVDYELIHGTVNGDRFFDFVRGSLISNMHSFPGVKSILVMDNCSIHHTEEVKTLLESVGILVVLPPYTPDYNPIEELFSYVKYYLKEHDEILQVTDNPSAILRSAFESITSSHCNGWISDCGFA